jgi:hypothetical protein
MTYDQKFISHSLELFSKIRQNASIQECLNTNAQAVAATATAANDPNEPLWFIYYMFFAIHNPKMEDYIQKKTASTPIVTPIAAAHIIKNMIKRRHHTSSIVFQLYTHAYTNEGNVTVIYPKDKDNLSTTLIKSFQSNRLKTTAVLLRKCGASGSATTHFIEYLITTQPTLSTVTSADTVLERINNHVSYKQKDIILLALTCYMKIDEDDINKKNIFISATPEEEKLVVTSISTATTTNTLSSDPHHPPSLAIASTTTYDHKYKYLYS